MSDEHGWRSEDLQPELVGGRDDYGWEATGAVRYMAFSCDGDILGYWWASDADDAASFGLADLVDLAIRLNRSDASSGLEPGAADA